MCDTYEKRDHPERMISLCVGIYLSYRAASSQVLSARVSLTAVFGMGTGVPSPSSAPTMLPRLNYLSGGLEEQLVVLLLGGLPPKEPSELNKVTMKRMMERTCCRSRCHQHRFQSKCVRLHLFEYCRSSPRSISTVKLKTSLSLHTQPINHVVFVGSYLITQWDILS